ncbi:hypothetical protein FF36_05979 [Frankia torreyi]|uniref:DUF4236 domain-containing protein n=1 Tax=Frankia torreyi TaxID=1856 RepID=Q9AF02_9ACTN|nr:hypothetical protein [Frankia torreyi]AAK20152.1 hypothetical protein [Frankia torreyi]KJE19724.1 hypothetical protein FF36_05979 [Frankia torreyi]KQM01812.1 hypothetical protein FF86_11042 [Frankia sp. CpI1-P]
MPIRVRAQRRLGPLRATITERGLSSVTLRVGRTSWRLWSRTGGRRGLTSVNLPGPLSWRPAARPRTAGQRAAAAGRSRRRWLLLTVLALVILAGAAAHGVDGRPLAALAVTAAVCGAGYLHRRRRP